MGWASASDIFDPVAMALLEAKASPELIRKTLVPLIDKLRDGDWDTYDESMDEFADEPDVIAAFHYAGCCPEMDHDEGYGEITYQSGNDTWLLECRPCGVLGTATATIAEHDCMVWLFVEHAEREHHGTGGVDRCWLIREAK